MSFRDFLHEATERGFVHQCTDPAALQALGDCAPGYIGFDATADSLHVGSLVQIMLLKLLQNHGHSPVVLMGGGTTRIGDPSGKDESRQMLTDQQIAANIAGIRRVFDPYLRFGDGPSDAVMVNNADWLDRLGWIDLLRDVGPHFTVNRMLTFDNVRLRLEREQPLTFLEFNYMILQSYDFRELSRRGVRLQMGGSDQWGNIVSGVELVRRTTNHRVFGLTTPLLTTASGAKMGKTAKGAVWLTEPHLHHTEFYQFWRNTDDRDVVRFLKLFTELPLGEINRWAALDGAEINEAKELLAYEATKLAHGVEKADSARKAASIIFEVVGTGHLKTEGYPPSVELDLPSIEIPEAELRTGLRVAQLFVQADLGESLSAIRRLIRDRGIRVNDVPVTDEKMIVGLGDLRDGAIKLSVGRKQHRLVRLSQDAGHGST